MMRLLQNVNRRGTIQFFRTGLSTKDRATTLTLPHLPNYSLGLPATSTLYPEKAFVGRCLPWPIALSNAMSNTPM